MAEPTAQLAGTVSIVTGAAQRLGANTARALHAAGSNVVIHYNRSGAAADELVSELNDTRSDSAVAIGTALGTRAQAEQLVSKAVAVWGRLDILVNNASSFFPTPMGGVKDDQVHDLLSSNFTAPFFLSQAAMTHLAQYGGCIINMVDIHALKPYANHSVYCAAKSALVMLTKSMAVELAPAIRVNGIAPGAILWPEGDGELSGDQKRVILETVPLQCAGTPDDISTLVVYLASDAAKYITGQILPVDGGRSLV